MGSPWLVPCACRTSLSPMSRPDLLEVLFSLIIYWKSWKKMASSRQDWSAWEVTNLDKELPSAKFSGCWVLFLTLFHDLSHLSGWHDCSLNTGMERATHSSGDAIFWFWNSELWKMKMGEDRESGAWAAQCFLIVRDALPGEWWLVNGVCLRACQSERQCPGWGANMNSSLSLNFSILILVKDFREFVFGRTSVKIRCTG